VNYLAALAWAFLRREFRATGKRLRHEHAAGRERATHEADTPDRLDLAELLLQLTQAEAARWHNGLVELHAPDGPIEVSAANARQLNHRILQKARAYFGEHGERQ